MKTTIRKFSRKVAFLGVLLATANVVMAQTSAITMTTTASAGTIREFSPDAITVTTDSSPTPVRYTYSKTTTFVDENGNPVSMETVKSGLPVTVYYNNDGDRLVATKMVVKKNVDVGPDGSVTRQTTTTSTTSSQGLVSSFTPDSMSVTSDSSPTPVSYAFTKTTTYVDENGNPVSVETVKSGVPVTVFYDRDGDRMVATRVVVRNTAPNATVVKKTTTTTTETNSNP
jgi:hypothetical protein